MGYYPNKVCCSLNVLTNLGYGMINAMVGGQILSKLSGGSVSVVVGIIIVALASWAMATFGMRIFQIYERYDLLMSLLGWADVDSMAMAIDLLGSRNCSHSVSWPDQLNRSSISIPCRLEVLKILKPSAWASSPFVFPRLFHGHLPPQTIMCIIRPQSSCGRRGA